MQFCFRPYCSNLVKYDFSTLDVGHLSHLRHYDQQYQQFLAAHDESVVDYFVQLMIVFQVLIYARFQVTVAACPSVRKHQVRVLLIFCIFLSDPCN